MSDMIIRFSGAFEFLSNFFPAPILWLGIKFPTSEHAYQASKARTHRERETIAQQPTPGKAKRMGQEVSIQPDWEGRKTEMMRGILVKKFEIPALRKMLLATRNMHLEEGNTWGDTFWGVCDGIGENNLGKLLMEIRDEIRSSGW